MPARFEDTRWRLSGAVDFDRNGSVDLIWQNNATFEVFAWLMTGAAVAEGRFLGPPLSTADWFLVSPK